MAQCKGKIHWFNKQKGYGYVTDENGNEYFYHKNNIKKGRQIVIEGFEAEDEVVFDLVQSEKGQMAINLELVNDVKPIFIRNEYKKNRNNNRDRNTEFSRAIKKSGYNTDTDKKVEVPEDHDETSSSDK